MAIKKNNKQVTLTAVQPPARFGALDIDEDLVTNFDSIVEELLEFCGLNFEKSCVEFYKTDRSVRTPSSEQVRQPIYTSGIEQWKGFDKHLAPLKKSLGNILDRYPIQD